MDYKYYGNRTIYSIIRLAEAGVVEEDWTSNQKNALDILFERYNSESREIGDRFKSFALSQYKMFRSNPAKTLKCVLTSFFSAKFPSNSLLINKT